MTIQVINIRKQFGDFVALNDVSLNIPGGSLVALLGPSGSGKTTLLRIIAGLEQADSGNIRVDDDDFTNMSARDRQVGFVFQHYALFKHMSVYENIAFGMRVRKVAKERIHARVMELVGLVRLTGLHNRLPSQLSGGQRQRVALARALAVRPNLLLLDEPFGALDAKVRQELRDWLRSLHEEMQVTTIFVTHDQEEAFEVADHVVVMRQGNVEQVGSPQEVFDHPATPFVMDFLGQVNVFQGRIQSGSIDLGGFGLELPQYDAIESQDATAYIRSHEVDLEHTASRPNSLPVKVVHVNPAGAVARVRLFSQAFGVTLNVVLPAEEYRRLRPQAGDEMFATPNHVRVFLPEDFAI